MGFNQQKKNQLHPKFPKNIESQEVTVWNLKIPYISPRIEKVINKLKYVIRSNSLNIIYTSRKLFSAFNHLLKPKVETLEKQNVIYQYTCDCSITYIGETEKIVKHQRFKPSFQKYTQSKNW